MRQHIELVGILYGLGGALALLVSVSLLCLGVGASGLIEGVGTETSRLAAAFSTVAFFVLAGVCLLWGLANLWVGRALRRLRPLGRLGALVLAVVNLFVLPFGTALSLYSLWVLLNHESRHLFESTAHPAQG